MRTLKSSLPQFAKEMDLCAQFMKSLPAGWTAYAETGGFDILLVRAADGFQIGVEAKLKLNGKVIAQVAERIPACYACHAGPDCRAVLVPHDASSDLAIVCRLLGIEVIRVAHPESRAWFMGKFHPELPDAKNNWNLRDRWFEFCPVKRLELPDYVPDTAAGDKCPVTLTQWKIGAMKLAILLEKTGFLARKDFKALDVSMSRWIQYGLSSWLVPSMIKGQWVKGRNFPDFAAQHPVNYVQIEADFDVWNPRKESGLLKGAANG